MIRSTPFPKKSLGQGRASTPAATWGVSVPSVKSQQANGVPPVSRFWFDRRLRLTEHCGSGAAGPERRPTRRRTMFLLPWLLCALSACSGQPSPAANKTPRPAASTAGTNSGPSSPSGPSTPALSKREADTLAAGLRSGSPSAVKAVLALPEGEAVPKAFVAKMAALKGLWIDPATSRDNGNGTATARAVLTGATGDVSTWTVMLARAGAGSWQVTATAPEGKAP